MAIKISNDQEFATDLKNNENVVIKYYADWCGTCKLFSPKYKRLSDDERFKHILFLDINAEESPEARQFAGVDTLPFFAIFKNGELIGKTSTSKEGNFIDLISQL